MEQEKIIPPTGGSGTAPPKRTVHISPPRLRREILALETRLKELQAAERYFAEKQAEAQGEKRATVDEWGCLPQEPCRFCRQQGGVHFLIDDGPEGRTSPQIVRCDKCGRDWVADSSAA